MSVCLSNTQTRFRHHPGVRRVLLVPSSLPNESLCSAEEKRRLSPDDEVLTGHDRPTPGWKWLMLKITPCSHRERRFGTNPTDWRVLRNVLVGRCRVYAVLCV